MAKCRICDNELLGSFEVKEMMFGFRDVFLYSECGTCGCLQISSYPVNMDKYYPSDYYSFSQDLAGIKTGLSTRLFLNLKHLARLAYFLLNPRYNANWPVRLRLFPNNMVLDIGCGNGARIGSWFNEGLNHLSGIDKYIKDGHTFSNQFKIMKGDFHDLNETYHLVMMHHTLEHLPGQTGVFMKVNQLLKKKGVFLVRIPVKSWAWNTYGVNWIQLDAPRHFYIHTEKSIQSLAKRTGFEIIDIVYDSWELQFIGSEKYLRDIPLHEKADSDLFSKEEILEFRQKAIQLNKERKGDQAAFVLRKLN
jgi:SAM-dependent methyltransferase